MPEQARSKKIDAMAGWSTGVDGAMSLERNWDAEMTFDPTTFDRRSLLGGAAASLLCVPPRAEASLAGADGFAVLEAKPGTMALKPGVATAIAGYGGQAPGPLLRIKKGQAVKVRLVNGLDEPTTLTWHGVRNQNAMDGVAGLTQKPVPPGGHFDYVFTPPDSGIYWYHPHIWPVGAAQTARGLHGVLVVDELNPPSVDEDLIMVIADWALDSNGRIEAAGAGPGAFVTVNGKTDPIIVPARPNARIRVRVLNVCPSRVSIVSIQDARVTIVAVDGQPCETFQPARDSVPVGPGSRFELMVDLPKVAGAARIILRGESEADRALMTFEIAGAPLPVKAPVAKLPDNPLLPTRIHLESSVRRDVVLAGPTGLSNPVGKGQKSHWTLDGIDQDGVSGKPLFTVRRGGAVTLTFRNTTAVVQQMHIHGHVWRQLHDLDDGWDPYWRDSVLLGPGKTKHVAFVADNPGKWALVSSIMERQETGLATWFEVT